MEFDIKFGSYLELGLADKAPECNLLVPDVVEVAVDTDNAAEADNFLPSIVEL